MGVVDGHSAGDIPPNGLGSVDGHRNLLELTGSVRNWGRGRSLPEISSGRTLAFGRTLDGGLEVRVQSPEDDGNGGCARGEITCIALRRGGRWSAVCVHWVDIRGMELRGLKHCRRGRQEGGSCNILHSWRSPGKGFWVWGQIVAIRWWTSVEGVG